MQFRRPTVEYGWPQLPGTQAPPHTHVGGRALQILDRSSRRRGNRAKPTKMHTLFQVFLGVLLGYALWNGHKAGLAIKWVDSQKAFPGKSPSLTRAASHVCLVDRETHERLDGHVVNVFLRGCDVRLRWM
eukprot:4542122-Pyramimonas_sp.AAC.1